MHFLIRTMSKQTIFPSLSTWDALDVAAQHLLSFHVSSPFIAYYTIVSCSKFNLILKCINTKDVIKYKVLEALPTEIKLLTG